MMPHYWRDSMNRIEIMFEHMQCKRRITYQQMKLMRILNNNHIQYLENVTRNARRYIHSGIECEADEVREDEDEEDEEDEDEDSDEYADDGDAINVAEVQHWYLKQLVANMKVMLAVEVLPVCLENMLNDLHNLTRCDWSNAIAQDYMIVNSTDD